MKYNNIIKVLQAYPVPNFVISNLTPVIGDTVTLTNSSKYEESFYWTINDGSVVTNPTTEIVNFIINSPGKINQKITVTNTVAVIDKIKPVFGIDTLLMAYCYYTIDKEVARTNESVTLTIINKFNYTGEYSLSLNIYDHNTSNVISATTLTNLNSYSFILNAVGIYDVELVTTTGEEICYYRQNMILTVTPALSIKNNAMVYNILDTTAAMEYYGVSFNICDGNNFNYTNTTIPAGSTILVKKSSTFNNTIGCRIGFYNLSGTSDNPIKIVFDDTDGVFDLAFSGFWGLLFNNCKHVYIDGRGYNNRELGCKIYPKKTGDGIVGCTIGGLSTYISIFNIELYNMTFCGLQAKTDPDANDYHTWRQYFRMEDFHVHHMYTHNTGGEGFYIGYYSTEYLGTGLDANNNTVQYRAHSIPNAKIYRNSFYRCGWDSLQAGQLTEASEVSYNSIEDSAWYGVADQNSCMSLSIEGEIAGNVIKGENQGLGIQVGFFGETKIYNNLITGLPIGTTPLFFLSSSGNPEQNANNYNNDIPIYIYNNNIISNLSSLILSAQNVCQYRGLVFENNLISCLNPLNNIFGGQNTTTTDLWYTNMKTNYRIEDYTEDDLLLLDIDNFNYNIFVNSKLKKGGQLRGSMYDIRGYKNWYTISKFIGAYCEFIKSPVTISIISNLIINNNNNATTNVVSISFSYTGTINEYIISENSSFNNAIWQEFIDINSITYTILDTTIGIKTIYLKTRNNAGDSNIISGTTNYVEDKRYVICLSKYTSYNLDIPTYYNRMVVDETNQDTIPIPLLTLSNLKDQYLNLSSLSISSTSQFDDYDVNNIGISNNILYYNQAKERKWVINKLNSISNKGTLVISNCDPLKNYEIRLFAFRYAKGSEQKFTVNNVSQLWNAGSNPETTCLFSGIVLTNNQIQIDVECTANTGESAFLSIIDVREYLS